MGKREKEEKDVDVDDEDDERKARKKIWEAAEDTRVSQLS